MINAFSTNVLPVSSVSEGTCQTSGVGIHAASADDGTAYIWIKPEEILLSSQPFESSARNQLRCAVVDWEHSGTLYAVRLRTGELTLTSLVTHASFQNLGIRSGLELYATFKSTSVHCF